MSTGSHIRRSPNAPAFRSARSRATSVAAWSPCANIWSRVMSDDIQDRDQHAPDDMGEIEHLLRELNLSDLELATPPPEVWAGIDEAVRGDTVVAMPLASRHS